MKAPREDFKDIVRDIVRNCEKWHLRNIERVHEKTDFTSWPACRAVCWSM